MELRDLEYFAKIAAHGNVRRTAEDLDMSPAALSKCLRRLEGALAAKLVLRTPKGVQLTAVGAGLLAQIERIRLTMDDVVREAEALSTGIAGRVRIGTSPLVAEETYLAYSDLLRTAPKVAITLDVSDNDLLIPSLQRGELDLVLNLLGEAPVPGCVAETLFHDDIVVFGSRSHRLAGRKSVAMEDLVPERWALSPINVQHWHWLFRGFESRGLPPPRMAFETRSLRLRLLAVSSSDLLGFTSRRVIQRSSAELRLKEIPIKEVAWRRPVGVLRRDGGYVSPATLRFVEILRSRVAGMPKTHTRHAR